MESTALKFLPTDDEIINFFLKNKIEGIESLGAPVVHVDDIYEYTPWELQALSEDSGDDSRYYFFSKSTKKRGKAVRSDGGRWKPIGTCHEIKREGTVIGIKKYLVFYEGRAAKLRRTDWRMLEYRTLPFDPDRGGYIFCKLRFRDNTTGLGPPAVGKSYMDDSVTKDLSSTSCVTTEEMSYITGKVSQWKDASQLGNRSITGQVFQLKDASRLESPLMPDYDAFISFQEDTHYNFTSHLYAALRCKGIRVCKEKGNKVAIEKARVLVIVFSKNYTSSQGCLDDLATIMECQGRKSKMVIPVFYHVSPFEVKMYPLILLSTSSQYKPADEVPQMKFSERKEKEKLNKRWRHALDKAIGIAGYVLGDRFESDLIDEIVKDVCESLSQNESKNMVGMDLRIEQLQSLLCPESPDVRRIGIWGMGGIGKTTIARETLKRITSQYESCHVVQGFHEELQDEFFSKILDVERLGIGPFEAKPSFMKTRLSQKKVCVILDDVKDSGELESLVRKLDWFGLGSRIIITSRNRRALTVCKVNDIYEVRALNTDESLQLLSQYAFQEDNSEVEDQKQLMQFVKYANGVPLALEILGVCLQAGRNHETCTILQELRQHPKFQECFRRCFDELDDNEKNILLDIACFFRGEHIVDVARLLDGCGFFAHIGITGLIDKSLITITDDRVEMHNFVQEMGRELVGGQCAEPERRSRLWSPEDISNILKESAGTDAIEGIFLDASKLRLNLDARTFERMYNLRLLKIYSSNHENRCRLHFPQGLECLPDKLRLLFWENYPLKSLPKRFNPKNLVELNLPNSLIKKLWKGTKNLQKLKRMRLSYSEHLIKIPRLSKAQNLEYVDLEGCKSLVKVTSSLHHLQKLVSLNLKGCSKLSSLPTMVHIESLEILNLSGCSGLESFPEVSPYVKELYLGGTAIKEIPSSIQHLSKLVKLDLAKSKRLEYLPTTICKLKCLAILNLSGCSRLESFPGLSKPMRSLWFLDLSKTAITELPPTISRLIGLQELRLVNCKNLLKFPDCIRNIRALRKVEFYDTDAHRLCYSPLGTDSPRITILSSIGSLLLHLTSSLQHSLSLRLYCLVSLCLSGSNVVDIPEDLCCLPSLTALDLSGGAFRNIPSNFKQFSKLEILKLGSLKRLTSLPELPSSLAFLDAHNCTSLSLNFLNSKGSILDCGQHTDLENSERIFKLTRGISSQDKAKEETREFTDVGYVMLISMLTSAWNRFQNKVKQDFKGQRVLEAPSLKMCFPAKTASVPEWDHVESRGYLKMPSNLEKNKNIVGFFFLVLVAFDENYCNDSGFALRCICTVTTKTDGRYSMDTIVHLWSKKEETERILGDHACVFADFSIHKRILEHLDSASLDDLVVNFQFLPVDQENRRLLSCDVEKIGVRLITMISSSSVCLVPWAVALHNRWDALLKLLDFDNEHISLPEPPSKRLKRA